MTPTRFVLTIADDGRQTTPTEVRLRAALKRLDRVFGFKCIDIHTAPAGDGKGENNERRKR